MSKNIYFLEKVSNRSKGSLVQEWILHVELIWLHKTAKITFQKEKKPILPMELPKQNQANFLLPKIIIKCIFTIISSIICDSFKCLIFFTDSKMALKK